MQCSERQFWATELFAPRTYRERFASHSTGVIWRDTHFRCCILHMEMAICLPPDTLLTTHIHTAGACRKHCYDEAYCFRSSRLFKDTNSDDMLRHLHTIKACTSTVRNGVDVGVFGKRTHTRTHTHTHSPVSDASTCICANTASERDIFGCSKCFECLYRRMIPEAHWHERGLGEYSRKTLQKGVRNYDNCMLTPSTRVLNYILDIKDKLMELTNITHSNQVTENKWKIS